MGYSTFDSRIKDALNIAESQGIKVDIIEDRGESLGEHQTVRILKLKQMVAILK